MKGVAVVSVAVIASFLVIDETRAFGGVSPNRFSQKQLLPSSRSWTSERQMFSGSGAPAGEDDDPEMDKKLEMAAKQMGFTVAEYKLVMRMQKQLAEDVSNLRATGGGADKGVTIEMDGNSPPSHLVVTITEEAKALGKEALEKELLAAAKQAGEESKKGQEASIKKMNQDVAEQLKTLGK